MIDAVVQAGTLAGVPAEFCRQWHTTMCNQGWRDNQGRYCVHRWRNLLTTYWHNEQAKGQPQRQAGKAEDQMTDEERRQAAIKRVMDREKARRY